MDGRDRVDSDTRHQLEIAAELGNALVAKNAALESRIAELERQNELLERERASDHDARLDAESTRDSALARVNMLMDGGAGALSSSSSTSFVSDPSDASFDHEGDEDDRESELLRLRKSVQSLRSQVSELTDALARVTAEAEAAERKVAAERRSNERLESMVADLNEELDVRARRAVEAQERAESQKKTGGAADTQGLAALAAEVGSLESSLLAERAEVRSLRASLAAHERGRASDIAVISDLRRECARLRGELEAERVSRDTGEAAREARGEREMELLGATVGKNADSLGGPNMAEDVDAVIRKEFEELAALQEKFRAAREAEERAAAAAYEAIPTLEPTSTTTTTTAGAGRWATKVESGTGDTDDQDGLASTPVPTPTTHDPVFDSSTEEEDSIDDKNGGAADRRHGNVSGTQGLALLLRGVTDDELSSLADLATRAGTDAEGGPDVSDGMLAARSLLQSVSTLLLRSHVYVPGPIGAAIRESLRESNISAGTGATGNNANLKADAYPASLSSAGAGDAEASGTVGRSLLPLEATQRIARAAASNPRDLRVALADVDPLACPPDTLSGVRTLATHLASAGTGAALAAAGPAAPPLWQWCMSVSEGQRSKHVDTTLGGGGNVAGVASSSSSSLSSSSVKGRAPVDAGELLVDAAMALRAAEGWDRVASAVRSGDPDALGVARGVRAILDHSTDAGQVVGTTTPEDLAAMVEADGFTQRLMNTDRFAIPFACAETAARIGGFDDPGVRDRVAGGAGPAADAMWLWGAAMAAHVRHSSSSQAGAGTVSSLSSDTGSGGDNSLYESLIRRARGGGDGDTAGPYASLLTEASEIAKEVSHIIFTIRSDLERSEFRHLNALHPGMHAYKLLEMSSARIDDAMRTARQLVINSRYADLIDGHPLVRQIILVLRENGELRKQVNVYNSAYFSSMISKLLDAGIVYDPAAGAGKGRAVSQKDTTPGTPSAGGGGNKGGQGTPAGNQSTSSDPSRTPGGPDSPVTVSPGVGAPRTVKMRKSQRAKLAKAGDA